jgi:hypothetical protein
MSVVADADVLEFTEGSIGPFEMARTDRIAGV